jgi:DNA-binding SARP family transcriptional activator
MRLTAAQDWAGDNLALGRPAAVIPALAAMTNDHPYSERLRELHMLALYRSGRQAEALAVFNEVRQLLATELGIDPGPQLQNLHLRVLNADPALMSVQAGCSRPGSRARCGRRRQWPARKNWNGHR